MAFFGPTIADICVVRGDSPVIPVAVTDDAGAAIDITGGVFTMTVDPSASPMDDTNNVFNVSGSIVSGIEGTLTFSPTIVDTDQLPAVYFYDVQMLLNGSIRTILKGKFEIQQDITKT